MRISAWTAAAAEELAGHEAAIERGLNTFIDVGLRLAAVRDKWLYRRDYATFEDYCAGRWNFSGRRGRQLIDAADLATGLPSGTIVPISESQTRELAGLTPQQAATVMRVAHERSNGKITATVISAARCQPWTDTEITTALDGYRIHPFIACYPAFKPDEWEQLSTSVGRRGGLIYPILLSPHGGTIIDGRFRYLALKWNGIDPAIATTWTGEPAIQRMEPDPRVDEDELVLAVVYALNCLRKHRTTRSWQHFERVTGRGWLSEHRCRGRRRGSGQQLESRASMQEGSRQPAQDLAPVRQGPGRSPRPDGVLDFTDDEATVARWWLRTPWNIGVRVPESMFVLDVDGPDRRPHPGKGLQALAELEDCYGPLPETFTQITGSGGLHLFFRRPPGKLSKTRLPAGLEYKDQAATWCCAVDPPGQRAAVCAV